MWSLILIILLWEAGTGRADETTNESNTSVVTSESIDDKTFNSKENFSKADISLSIEEKLLSATTNENTHDLNNLGEQSVTTAEILYTDSLTSAESTSDEGENDSSLPPSLNFEKNSTVFTFQDNMDHDLTGNKHFKPELFRIDAKENISVNSTSTKPDIVKAIEKSNEYTAGDTRANDNKTSTIYSSHLLGEESKLYKTGLEENGSEDSVQKDHFSSTHNYDFQDTTKELITITVVENNPTYVSLQSTETNEQVEPVTDNLNLNEDDITNLSLHYLVNHFVPSSKLWTNIPTMSAIFETVTKGDVDESDTSSTSTQLDSYGYITGANDILATTSELTQLSDLSGTEFVPSTTPTTSTIHTFDTKSTEHDDDDVVSLVQEEVVSEPSVQNTTPSTNDEKSEKDVVFVPEVMFSEPSVTIPDVTSSSSSSHIDTFDEKSTKYIPDDFVQNTTPTTTEIQTFDLRTSTVLDFTSSTLSHIKTLDENTSTDVFAEPPVITTDFVQNTSPTTNEIQTFHRKSEQDEISFVPEVMLSEPSVAVPDYTSSTPSDINTFDELMNSDFVNNTTPIINRILTFDQIYTDATPFGQNATFLKPATTDFVENTTSAMTEDYSEDEMLAEVLDKADDEGYNFGTLPPYFVGIDDLNKTADDIFNENSDHFPANKVGGNFRGILETWLKEQKEKQQQKIIKGSNVEPTHSNRSNQIHKADSNDSIASQEYLLGKADDDSYFYGRIVDDVESPCILLNSTFRVYLNGSQMKFSTHYDSFGSFKHNRGSIIFYTSDESNAINASVHFNISCTIKYCYVAAIGVTLRTSMKDTGLISGQEDLDLFKTDYGFASENANKLKYPMKNGIVLEIDHSKLHLIKHCNIEAGLGESAQRNYYKEIIGGAIAMLILTMLGTFIFIRNRQKHKLVLGS